MSDIINRNFDVGSHPTLVQIGVGAAAAAGLVWYLVARPAARRRKQEAKRRAEEMPADAMLECDVVRCEGVEGGSRRGKMAEIALMSAQSANIVLLGR